jgi:hypothetical protein
MLGEQPLSRRRSAPSFSFGGGISRFQPSTDYGAGGPSVSPAAAYMLKGALGAQVDARRPSAMSVPFSTAERFPPPKASATVPGPASYPLKGTIGRQADSRLSNSASFGFGTTERRHAEKVFISEEHSKIAHAYSTPAPQLAHAGAFGPQPLSSMQSPPPFRIGKQRRFEYDALRRAAQSPAPGAYHASTSSFGKSLTSSRSAASAVFGTSSREHESHRFFSNAHQRSLQGLHSPAPIYDVPGSVGNQPLSRHPSLPAFSFQKGNRCAGAAAAPPGSRLCRPEDPPRLT